MLNLVAAGVLYLFDRWRCRKGHQWEAYREGQRCARCQTTHGAIEAPIEPLTRSDESGWG